MKENRSGDRNPGESGEYDESKIALDEIFINRAEKLMRLRRKSMTPTSPSMKQVEVIHRCRTAFHCDFDLAGLRLANSTAHRGVEILIDRTRPWAEVQEVIVIGLKRFRSRRWNETTAKFEVFPFAGCGKLQ